MFRLKSLGALVVAPLTCLSVLACDIETYLRRATGLATSS
jgi:hypothetical protein